MLLKWAWAPFWEKEETICLKILYLKRNRNKIQKSSVTTSVLRCGLCKEDILTLTKSTYIEE